VEILGRDARWIVAIWRDARERILRHFFRAECAPLQRIFDVRGKIQGTEGEHDDVVVRVVTIPYVCLPKRTIP